LFSLPLIVEVSAQFGAIFSETPAQVEVGLNSAVDDELLGSEG
jgi:hypothetical protein